MTVKACGRGEARVRIRHPYTDRLGKRHSGYRCVQVGELLEGKWFLNRKKTDVSNIDKVSAVKGIWLTLEHGTYDVNLLVQAQTRFDEWSTDLLDPKGYVVTKGG